MGNVLTTPISGKRAAIGGIALVLVLAIAGYDDYSRRKRAEEAEESQRAAAAEVARKEQARVASLTPAQRAAEERKKQEQARSAAKVAAATAAKQKELNDLVTRFGAMPTRRGLDETYSPVKRYLEDALNDPDSLNMVSCSGIYEGQNGWLAACTFRAKNGFGALVKETKWFTIRHGKVVRVEPESAHVR